MCSTSATKKPHRTEMSCRKLWKSPNKLGLKISESARKIGSRRIGLALSGPRVRCATAVTLALAIASCSEAQDDIQPPLNLRICPANSEADAIEILGLSGGTIVELDDLLTKASASGYRIEAAPVRLTSMQCVQRPDDPSKTIYIVHAGFDRSKSHTRHFVVISDTNGVVTDIEMQRDYAE